MKLETSKGTRKCEECGGGIYTGETVGIIGIETLFGTRYKSFCKVCCIQGLLVKRMNINVMLKKLKEG